MSNLPRAVLIVDDAAVSSAIIARQLHALGVATVEETRSGHAALIRVEQGGPFDLLIIDYRMPTMDGLELLAQLGALWARTGRAPVPVVVISIDDAEDTRARVMAAGASAFYSKPVTEAKLRTMLADLPPRQDPAS